MNVMTIGLRSAFAITLLGGCFTKSSAQYACVDDADCFGGRTCSVSGFCVLPDDDAGIGSDGMGGEADDPCTGFEARHFQACMIPRPTMPMSLPGPGTYVFNTTDGTLLDLQNNPQIHPNVIVNDARVVSVESFSLSDGAILRVKGTYPLVIASFSTMDIGGRIDASSTSLERGAGAAVETPSAFCATRLGTLPGGAGDGGGGGAGGSMQSDGGDGGQGANRAGGVNGPGAGATPPLLAAGCPGQQGGLGRNAGQLGGLGGAGGGAVQLTAKTSITVAASARINVSGAAGRPGTNDSAGGGGGGAGGMIGFEAPMLTIMPGALLAANGGAGSQGGGSGGTPGTGQDGQLSTIAAAGGEGGSGGEGGDGSISAAAAIDGQDDGGGGGGGGGGAGYITIKSAMRLGGGTFSPPTPTTIP